MVRHRKSFIIKIAEALDSVFNSYIDLRHFMYKGTTKEYWEWFDAKTKEIELREKILSKH